MTDLKRRQKTKTAANHKQHVTATSVVLAIGQRVQDTASFHAMTATIQDKQREFVESRKRDALLDQQEKDRVAASGIPEDLLPSPELTGYNNSTNEVGAGT